MTLNVIMRKIIGKQQIGTIQKHMKKNILFFLAVCIFFGQTLRAQSTTAVRKPQATKILSADEYAAKGDDCFYGTNGEFMNRDKAKEYWLKAAKMGHAGAQFVLVANKMVVGEEAMKLLRSSAEQMYPDAMNFMSRLYHEKGDYDWFPEQDLAQSLYWARLSAEKGDAEGQYLYAGHYLQGIGVQKKTKEAEKWLTQSAEQGYIESMNALAVAYKVGWFGSPDQEKMLYWWKQSAETGDAKSQYKYGEALFDIGDGIEYEKEAFIWFKKAADQEYVEAFSDMAMFYMCGWGDCDIDIPTALKWARKGMVLNDAACCWLVSEIGRENGNVPFDDQMRALESAANQGYLNAQAQLSVYHFYSLTPNPDPAKGLPLLTELANSRKSSRAMVQYGLMLMFGNENAGIPRDEELGTELIRSSAQMGDRMGISIAKEYNIQL